MNLDLRRSYKDKERVKGKLALIDGASTSNAKGQRKII